MPSPDLGQRCARCGAVQYPTRTLCRICGSRLLRPYALTGRGVLHAPAARASPQGHSVPPTLLFWIALEEGLLIPGRLIGAQPQEAIIGLPVELLPRRDYGCNDVKTPPHDFRPVRFRPAVRGTRAKSRYSLRLVYSAKRSPAPSASSSASAISDRTSKASLQRF